MDRLTQTQVFVACLEAAGVIFVPVMCVFIAFHLQNRSERKKFEASIATERIQFRAILRNFRLHKHGERHGPLTVDGIDYPETNGG